MKNANAILVPIDFSNDSRLALQMADYQAHAWNAELILLYVDRGIIILPMKPKPLLDFVPYIKYTLKRRIVCVNCPGEPADAIAQVADHFRVRAIFMGYGRKSGDPGRIAISVKRRFQGNVQLFSETMAPYISQAA